MSSDVANHRPVTSSCWCRVQSMPRVHRTLLPGRVCTHLRWDRIIYHKCLGNSSLIKRMQTYLNCFINHGLDLPQWPSSRPLSRSVSLKSRQNGSDRHRHWLMTTIEGSATAVDIGAVTVQISHSVKSLGVTIDDTLSFINQHVDNVWRQPISIREHCDTHTHIRRWIAEDTAKSVWSAIVAGRLDYCKSVL